MLSRMPGKDDSPVTPQVTERETALMAAFAGVMGKLVDRLDRLERPDRPSVAHQGMSPDEAHSQMMRDVRGDPDEQGKVGLVTVVVGCTSDMGAPDSDGNMHGATFDAELHEKPIISNGRLVGKAGHPVVRRLLNYTWPVGIDKHQADGGVVPSGMTMQENGHETDAYKQWKYETFYLADARRFLGRPLPAHLKPVKAA